MADRVASFTIGFGADDVDIRSALANLKREFQSTAQAIEATTRKVDLFSGLEDKVKASADAMADAVANAKKLQDQLDAVQKSGGKASDDLTKGLRAANEQAVVATREFNRNVDAISKLQAQLSRAGVDTKNLATEQQRLAAQSRAVADAAAEQASKQLLGLKTLKDVTPEIQRLNAAYNTLASSGTLSAKELAVAQQQLRDRVAETKAGITELGRGAREGGNNLLQFFTGSLAPALGLTLSIKMLIDGINEAVAASRALRQAGAEIGAATSLSSEQIAELRAGAERLSDTIGIGVVDAMKALQEIVRSTGFSTGDALAVLRDSAISAKGSFTELGTVTSVSADLISAFRLNASQLAPILDGIAASAKAGGPKFSDLAGNIGNLSVVAASLGVSAQEMVAYLNIMTSASGDAAGSIGALQRIMTSFNTAAVRDGLREAGIEATTFRAVLQELAEKGIPITRLTEFGVVTGKTAVGVAALTRSVQDQSDAFERQAAAAGVASEALEKYKASPKGLSDKLGLELEKSKVIIGDYLSSIDLLTRTLIVAAQDGNNFLRYLLDVRPPLQALSAGSAAVADALALQQQAATASAEALTKNRTESDALAVSLDATSKKLLANATAIQEATASGITVLTKAATDQIKALDQSVEAQATTAAKTVEIQKKLGEEILKLLTENEAKAGKARDAAIAARVSAMRQQAATETQIESERQKMRLAFASSQLAQYQSEYERLLALNQGYNASLNKAEQDRLSFNQGIERQLFAIRLEGLGSFDQYVAKVQESERLVALAREAGAKGNTELAQKYANEAIAVSNTIGRAFSANGAEIVSAWDATNQKTKTIRDAQDAVNLAFTKAGDAAKTGADATSTQLQRVLPIVEQYRDAIKQANEAATKGATLNITIDQDSARAAEARLVELTRDRTVNVIVNQIAGTGLSVAPGLATGGPVGAFRAGGPVQRLVQAFAAGGGVFRRPLWSKVPGVGDGDTVPALLQEGSFVVRKAASRHYGDGIMARLTRGYAEGGAVGGMLDTVRRFAIGGAAQRYLGGGTESADAAAWRETRRDSEATITDLIAAATGLPPAYWGDDIRAYLARVLEMIRLARSAGEAKALWDRFKGDVDSIRAAIAQSHQLSVPLVYWAGSLSGPAVSGGDRSLGVKPDDMAVGRRNPGSNFTTLRFADGGAVGTDTVPALLTPGEWVIPRNVARALGGGFLSAINAMRAPRDALSGLGTGLMPMRRFATGGPVPGATIPQAGTMAAAGGVNITINATGADFRDESAVRRLLLPVIRDIQRRTG